MQRQRPPSSGSHGPFVLAAVLGVAASAALAQPVTISGIVVDELSCEPLAGVDVRIGVPGAIRAQALTDNLGRFEASFASEAQLFDVAVEASKSYLPCRLQRVASGSQVQISLAPRTCAITGRAIDAASGEPIAYAWVTASDGVAYAARTQSDASGVYRLPVDTWESAAPTAENRLRSGIEVALQHRDYLPTTVHGIDLETYAYSPTPAPLDLSVEPYRQEVVIEAYLAGTRSPAGGVAFVYGCGPHITGRSVTDALGRARARVPAWRFRDRPVEMNEPADAWVAHLGQQFQPVRASGVQPGQASGTPRGARAHSPSTVRFSLAPLESTTARSTYLVSPLAYPTEEPLPQGPGEVSKPLPPDGSALVI